MAAQHVDIYTPGFEMLGKGRFDPGKKSVILDEEYTTKPWEGREVVLTQPGNDTEVAAGTVLEVKDRKGRKRKLILRIQE